eukprot:m.23187 g.23187  ORF g.23187 m.23187 type:complete len:207 (-) comp14110_c0_seq1:95-715(-)
MLTPRQHNIISYAGAAVIFAAVGISYNIPSGRAMFAAIMWMVHFTRRTYESALVHQYSSPKISVLDSAIEFAYYWGFGWWIVTAVLATNAEPYFEIIPVWISFFGWGVAEVVNGVCHAQLASIPPRKDDKPRTPPKGLFYDYIACPHYLAEILSWVFFALAFPTTSTLVFSFVGTCILSSYAKERLDGYRRDHPNYNLASLVPGLL